MSLFLLSDTRRYTGAMAKLPRNIWVLLAAQAMNQSCASMVVLIGGIIGSQLAPTMNLATMPIASAVVGAATGTVPAVMASKRWGRKPVFYVGILLSIAGALLCSLALFQEWFIGFCGGALLIGSSLSVVQQYRFAAMESVSVDLIPTAASRLLLAGLVAAFLGPELAVWGRDLLPTPYMASFLSLVVLNIVAALILTGYRGVERTAAHQAAPVQDWRQLLGKPVLWVAILGASVGYAVMAFVMTATPLSMHVHSGHDLLETKRVIQSHIVAMYLPSLLSGWLIGRFGTARIMLAGCLALLAVVWIGSQGITIQHYWVALVLLGIGWNFMFVSGTALLPASYGDGEPFRVQALNEAVVFGSQAIASLSAGWVLWSLGWKILLYSCVPFIAAHLLLLAYWRLIATDLPTQHPAPPSTAPPNAAGSSIESPGSRSGEYRPRQ